MKTNFFEYLDFALQFAPAQENEKEIRAQLARIGVGAGKTLNFKDLSLEDKAEIVLGMKEGDRKIDEAVANAGKNVNGWRLSSLFGDSAFFNGEKFSYGALTAGHGGVREYDPYCLKLSESFAAAASSLAYFPGDSITICFTTSGVTLPPSFIQF